MYTNTKYNEIKLYKFVKWTFLLTLLILVFCHFRVPDYYTNRELAHAALTTNPDITQLEFNNTYRNPYYFFYNFLFHICAISFEVILLRFFYNTNLVKRIIEIKWLEHTLRFLYLNVAYPIWAILTMVIVELELKNYIYVSVADSIMIPLLGAYALLYILAFLYYPIVNIFNFIVFNTKITNKFLVLIYKILFVIMALNILINMTTKFNIFFIAIHFLEIIYLWIVIQSINRLQNKTQ